MLQNISKDYWEVKSIETYYLIDYENVNCDGLKGCDKLIKSDHVIIFFTKNASKISMSEVADHGDAELEMIEILPGKQSVDIHISSYLGYLAGKNNNESCRIAIISKDLDFDKVIKFWKDRIGVKVSRADRIMSSVPTAAHTKQKPTHEKTDLKKNDNERQRINNEIMQILSKAGFENKISGFVASTVVNSINVKDRKQAIYKIIVEKYGEGQGLNIYNHIRKHI